MISQKKKVSKSNEPISMSECECVCACVCVAFGLLVYPFSVLSISVFFLFFFFHTVNLHRDFFPFGSPRVSIIGAVLNNLLKSFGDYMQVPRTS